MIESPSRVVVDLRTSDLLRMSRTSFDAGEHVEGERLARQALGGAVAAIDPEAQHEAWDLIAQHAERRGAMELVASAAEEALALLPAEAAEARARLHCRLARVFAVLELDAAHLQHATEAVVFARACGETELICLALSRLGTAVAVNGDWSQAVVLIRQALVLARTADNPAEVVRALSNLAAVHYYSAIDAMRRGEPAASSIAAQDGLASVEEALALHPASGDEYTLLTAQLNRILLLVEVGRYAEALAGCDAMDDAVRRHGYREVFLKLAFARGKATALLGDHAGGVASLERTLASMADDDPALRGRVHEELYLLQKRAGDFAGALAHHEAVLALERTRSVRRATRNTDCCSSAPKCSGHGSTPSAHSARPRCSGSARRGCRESSTCSRRGRPRWDAMRWKTR